MSRNQLRNFRAIVPGKVYRSANPDQLTREQWRAFHEEHGIKTVIDLRLNPKFATMLHKPVSVDTTRKQAEIFADVDKEIRELTRSQKVKDDQHWVGLRLVLPMTNTRDYWDQFQSMPLKDRVQLVSQYLAVDVTSLWNSGDVDFIKLHLGLGLTGAGVAHIAVLQHGAKTIKTILQIASDERFHPIMFHCAYGKDRTGVLAYVFHRFMGKSRDEIVEDYMESGVQLKKFNEQAWGTYKDSWFLDPTYSDIKAASMRQLIDFVDSKYGSVENYMEAIGFSRKEQDKLRRVLQDNFIASSKL